MGVCVFYPKFSYIFLSRYACHGLCLSLCSETRIPLAYSVYSPHLRSKRGGCTRDILMTLLLTDLRTKEARSVSHTLRSLRWKQSLFASFKRGNRLIFLFLLREF